VVEARDRRATPFCVTVERPNGGISRFECRVLAEDHPAAGLNLRYAERVVKSLLWLKGGFRVRVAGAPETAAQLASIYSPKGERAFDHGFLGEVIYRRPFDIGADELGDLPQERAPGLAVGRHLDGCRIGFDLGGSSRKAVAVSEGRVVFSEEASWDPCFQRDPGYYIEGVGGLLQRAAEHLSRVDAIGGSAAGTCVNKEVRAASLFRGVPADLFATRIRRMFLELQKRWGGVPFVVMNDGEVSALVGSMTLGANAAFGTSMGTSQAGGYVTAAGELTSWFNEPAFAPVDFRPDAPRDERSGDAGCGTQYFSQQGVARLAVRAGFPFPRPMTFPERLAEVQAAMRRGESRGARIYDSIGVHLGYAIAQYADHYGIRHVLVSGGVTSGPGGERMLAQATAVLRAEFPELAQTITCHMPEEKDKRLGQAIAAASLRVITRSGTANPSHTQCP
jgi:predicted NBD/HSP70 family sugar kinase